ncbi:MAG: hypothetical protein ACRDMX_03510 [Solirubrobacteraceae bacterium]
MAVSAQELARARERARAARRLLGARRARRRLTAYQIYVTVIFCAVFGALGGRAIAVAVAGGLTIVQVAAFGPAVLALALLAGARFGVWQGPVSFRAADVALLLTAPLAIDALVRPKLDRSLAVGAGAGILIAGVVLVLVVSGAGAHPGAVRAAAWVASLAAFTVLVTAVSWLVESSRRLAVLVRRFSPLAVALAGALLAAGLAGSAGRLAGFWSGPWGWTIAPLTGSTGGNVTRSV